MVTYSELAFRLFGSMSENFEKYFTDLKLDLRRADFHYTPKEFLSRILFTSLLAFLIQLPVFSFLFGFVFGSFLFGFLFAITVTLATTAGIFFVMINYPRYAMSQRANDLEKNLPFATLYLSTIAGSQLPLYQVLEIFSRFAPYKEVKEQIDSINNDVKVFGIDINTSLERAVTRSPSKKFRELIYGILSTIRSGANVTIFLSEKSKTYMNDYRRKLAEYSHSLTIYIEIYLTALVLGAIFFTILTAIIAGVVGGTSNIVMLQFLLVFIFMPIISVAFLFLIKKATPGGE